MCVVKFVFSVVVYNWAQSLQEFRFWLVFARLFVGPILILNGLCLSLSVFQSILHDFIQQPCHYCYILEYDFRPTGNHQNAIHQPKKTKLFERLDSMFKLIPPSGFKTSHCLRVLETFIALKSWIIFFS